MFGHVTTHPNQPTVESLQSRFILTMSHWSSGLPVCFPSQGTWVEIPWGYLCVTEILLLVLSHFIGDPDVIDHCGLVWGRPRPEPSLGPCTNNVIIPLDLTQLFCPGFTLAAGLPSGFKAHGVGCWGGALWRVCNLISFSTCLTGPVDYLFASGHKEPGFKSPGGYLYERGILLLVLSCYTTVKKNMCFVPWILRENDCVSVLYFFSTTEIFQLTFHQTFLGYSDLTDIPSLQCM